MKLGEKVAFLALCGRGWRWVLGKACERRRRIPSRQGEGSDLSFPGGRCCAVQATDQGGVAAPMLLSSLCVPLARDRCKISTDRPLVFILSAALETVLENKTLVILASGGSA